MVRIISILNPDRGIMKKKDKKNRRKKAIHLPPPSHPSLLSSNPTLIHLAQKSNIGSDRTYIYL